MRNKILGSVLAATGLLISSAPAFAHSSIDPVAGAFENFIIILSVLYF